MKRQYINVEIDLSDYEEEIKEAIGTQSDNFIEEVCTAYSHFGAENAVEIIERAMSDKIGQTVTLFCRDGAN